MIDDPSPVPSGSAKVLTFAATALLAALLLSGCAMPRSQPTTRAVDVEPPRPRQTPSEAVPAISEPLVIEEPEAWSEELTGTPPAVETMPVVAPDEMTVLDPVTASPLDALAEIPPEPTPEELARLRQRTVSKPVEPEFDIPIEMNDKVRAWIDRYTVRHKTSFEAGLGRSTRYMDQFREIFAEAGLPKDLVYMAHVESGYKTSAYSRAHARGIFQFIAATGKRYGLRVDYWADERADPEKSARAAAAYMKDLYDEFGDWYLAFAAYNAGEGKIRRALARSGKKDFWGIAKSRHIRTETKNHIPAILAATVISKNPAKYGLRVVYDDPIYYDTITVDGAADLRVLAKCADTDLDTLRDLNPAIRRNQTPPDGSFDVRVPVGSGPQAYAALMEIPVKERVLYARHRVKRGDTLGQIARHHGVTVRAIQDANGMGRRTMIRINQTVLVPTSGASRYADLGPSQPTDLVRGEPIAYQVRRGDTLYGIARRHNTSPASIAAASGISTGAILSIGQRLTVVPGVRSTAEAQRVAQGGGGSDRNGDVVHTVRRGDTLWRIANLYRTTVNVICSMNGISPSATLYPGNKLTVGRR